MSFDKTNDGFKMHGAVTMILKKANGEHEVVHKDNIIVNVGFDFIADAIGKAASRPSVMGYIAVGTGSAAPAAADAALGTELFRKAATYAHVAGTKVFTFTTTLNPGEATGAITEAGVINAGAGGILFDRVTFPVVNKGADDTLQSVFTFTMS